MDGVRDVDEGRKLRERLIEVAHTERVHLAAALHKGVQQDLSALMIRLSSLPPSEHNTELRELVSHAVDSIQATIRPLVPGADLSLSQALNELATLLSQKMGLRVRTAPGPERRYHRSIELVAYDAERILLTALARAGLTECSLSMHETSAGELRLMTEFSEFESSLSSILNELSEGPLGLLQTSARVELEGQRTTVVIDLPLGGVS